MPDLRFQRLKLAQRVSSEGLVMSMACKGKSYAAGKDRGDHMQQMAFASYFVAGLRHTEQRSPRPKEVHRTEDF